MTDAARKAERKAIRRAARRAGAGAEAGDIEKAVRYAQHRAPGSRKSKLAAGIVAKLRQGRGR